MEKREDDSQTAEFAAWVDAKYPFRASDDRSQAEVDHWTEHTLQWFRPRALRVVHAQIKSRLFNVSQETVAAILEHCENDVRHACLRDFIGFGNLASYLTTCYRKRASEKVTELVTQGPQFPFRATSPEHQARLNQEISHVLVNVEDMIYKLIRKRLPHTDYDTRNEIAQKCMIWLWQKSIPKYDAHRNTKLTTFVYRCIQNFVKQEVRALARRSRLQIKTHPIDSFFLLEAIQANDTKLDHKIEALSLDIIEHPERYLTKAQAQVFSQIVDSDELMKDIADKLGYQRASSLSMMLRRVKDKIAQVDIEEFDG